MKIDAKQFARILIEAVEGRKSEDVTAIIKEFVNILKEKQMLDKWRDIERAIHTIWKEKYGASSIKILSAHTLNDETRKMINSIAPGADLKERVDEQLIGGAVIRIDDTRIDGSVVGKLQNWKHVVMK